MKRGSFMYHPQEKGKDIGERAYEMANRAIHSGMLLKQSRKIGIKWRNRFVVVMPNKVLYYFNSPTDTHTLSQVDLSRVERIVPNSKSKKYGIEFSEDGRAYYFAAENEKDQAEWIEVLQRVRSGQHLMTPTRRDSNVSASSPRHHHSTRHLAVAGTHHHHHHHHHHHLHQEQIHTAPTAVLTRRSIESRVDHPWKQWAVDTMRTGSVAFKYGFLSDNKPKRRFLQLSADRGAIRWGTGKCPDDDEVLNRVLPIECIEGVTYGPFSETLTRYNERGELRRGSWKCLSVHVRVPNSHDNRRRTIDLQFREENDVIGWFIGLEVLALENAISQGAKSDRDINSTLNEAMTQFKSTKLRLQVEEAAHRAIHT